MPGHIKPVIDKVFPFEQAKEALAYLAQGRAKGKVVVGYVAKSISKRTFQKDADHGYQQTPPRFGVVPAATAMQADG